MAVAVAVAVAVSGGGAVALAVAGLTKRFFNHIQKDFLINVWGLSSYPLAMSQSPTSATYPVATLPSWNLALRAPEVDRPSAGVAPAMPAIMRPRK